MSGPPQRSLNHQNRVISAISHCSPKEAAIVRRCRFGSSRETQRKTDMGKWAIQRNPSAHYSNLHKKRLTSSLISLPIETLRK